MGHAHLHQRQHQKRNFWDDVADLVDGFPGAQQTATGDRVQRGKSSPIARRAAARLSRDT